MVYDMQIADESSSGLIPPLTGDDSWVNYGY